MKGLILFLIGLQTAQAGTVLLPAFMPESPEDKAHADRFHDVLLIELVASGYTAIGQDALRSRVGQIVDTCAITVDCPKQLFTSWPAPVAIIGEVYADGDDMGVVTSIYAVNNSAPIRVFDQTVRVGDDWTGVTDLMAVIESLMPEEVEEDGVFALLEEDIANVTAVQAEGLAEEAEEAEAATQRVERHEKEIPLSDDAILSLLGLGDEPALVEEDPFESVEEFVEEPVEEPVELLVEDPVELLVEDPVEEPLDIEDLLDDDLAVLIDIPVADEGPEFDPAALDEAAEDAATSEAPEWNDNRDLPDRKSLNLDGILYGALQRSHQDLDSWLQKMRPHRNNGHIEVFGGMPYGDTVRSYDVRVALDAASLEQIGLSERDIYTEGVGYEFGAAIGFTPSPWMDLSALFSLMGGTKELTTGWATIDGNIVQDSDVFEHNSTRSLSAIVEPRMRLYLLPVSWMKIYGLGGITVRFADAYTVPDLNVVDYPDRPSWTMVGWMVGGGLMFDPHERLGIYVETPWVHWFQPGDSYSTESGVLPPILPGSVEKTGWVLRGTAGVQFRL
jgi:opacity protein-like surface antigen